MLINIYIFGFSLLFIVKFFEFLFMRNIVCSILFLVMSSFCLDTVKLASEKALGAHSIFFILTSSFFKKEFVLSLELFLP